MTTEKYATQGEWVTTETQELGWVRYLKAPSNEIADDVARTLNAAPELLAALRDAVEELKHAAHIVNLDEDAIGRAKAAIAKATSEPVMAA